VYPNNVPKLQELNELHLSHYSVKKKKSKHKTNTNKSTFQKVHFSVVFSTFPPIILGFGGNQNHVL